MKGYEEKRGKKNEKNVTQENYEERDVNTSKKAKKKFEEK